MLKAVGCQRFKTAKVRLFRNVLLFQRDTTLLRCLSGTSSIFHVSFDVFVRCRLGFCFCGHDCKLLICQLCFFCFQCCVLFFDDLEFLVDIDKPFRLKDKEKDPNASACHEECTEHADECR